jgi:hypothetical protein
VPSPGPARPEPTAGPPRQPHETSTRI